MISTWAAPAGAFCSISFMRRGISLDNKCFNALRIESGLDKGNACLVLTVGLMAFGTKKCWTISQENKIFDRMVSYIKAPVYAYSMA